LSICGDWCSCLSKCRSMRLVRQPLVLERQQDPPGKRAAAAPIESECHGADCSGCAPTGGALSFRFMEFQTLIGVDSLRELKGEARLVVVDCRFDLLEPQAGRRAFLAAHIRERAMRI